MKNLFNNWEFNVLGVYNYNLPGKLDNYYKWISNNHLSFDGDILEAGVFKGKSIIATAMFLKELGSKKKVYGYDSFSGFPPIYHKNDNLDMFNELYKDNKITKNHYLDHLKLKEYRKFIHNSSINVKNISSSNDFSNTSEDSLQKKIDYLGLDNIILVKGDFNETMNGKSDFKLIAALIDCDLYSSYKIALPFIWKKLCIGGYIYLDEYYSLKFAGARIASNEFLKENNHKALMHKKEAKDFERWYVVKKK